MNATEERPLTMTAMRAVLTTEDREAAEELAGVLVREANRHGVSLEVVIAPPADPVKPPSGVLGCPWPRPAEEASDPRHYPLSWL